MLFLRQGATHKVVIGPVVAVGDGFTPVTTLAVTTADEAEVILHDNGTVVDISGYTFAAITTADGYYHLTLQSGISGTVGHMTVVINDDSLCLPVKADFTVVEEATYDALFAASAPGPATPTNITAGTITTATNVTTVNGLAANVITAASMNADASAEIADAVWDEDATGHQTGGTFGQAIGDPGADATTIYQSVVTDAAGTNIAADIIAIEAQTDDIGAAGAGLTAVPWNAAWDAEVESEVNDALVVHRLDELMNADSDIDGAAPPTVGSVFHELLTKTAGSFTYDQTTDSLEAVRDNMGTAQTGDAFARLGAPAGASIAADLVVIDNFVDDIESRLGTPSDLGSGATVAANLVDIEGQTDDIGVAGAGLTAVPWNAAWDAEVQSEVTDALTTALTEGYAADGATFSVAQALYMMWAFIAEKSISGTTLTANKLDGTTAAMAFTLDDATNPTSITRAS